MDRDRAPVFEDLGPDDCLELLRGEHVGRVALTARALPIVLPVNFAVLEGDIVWRCAQGTKLNDASAGFVVAFEVDNFKPDHRGWSVMIQGLAHVVTEDEELARVSELPLEPWSLDGMADRYVCLVPNTITGTRICHS